MAVKEMRFTMSVAALIASSTGLAGYSHDALSANPALLAFLDRAQASLVDCDAVALDRMGATMEGPNAARQCASDAERQMEPS